MHRKGLVIGILILMLGVNIGSSFAGDVDVKTISSIGFDGNTIYVDDDNINGPWYGTLEHPFKKIEDGIDAATDGDIVYVFNGVYGEGYLNIEKSINLIGEDRSNTVIASSSSYDQIMTIKGSGVKISGFTLKNSGGPLFRCAAIRIWRATDIIISNNVIENNGQMGIYIVSSSHNLIFNNIIRNNGGTGISIQSSAIPMGSSSFNKIIRNHLENNYWGIYLYGFHTGRSGLGGNLFIQNNFINNDNPGAFYKDSFHNFWFNNYWNGPANHPVRIEGIRTLWNTWNGPKTIEVNKFDLFPAQEPYDIGA